MGRRPDLSRWSCPRAIRLIRERFWIWSCSSYPEWQERTRSRVLIAARQSRFRLTALPTASAVASSKPCWRAERAALAGQPLPMHGVTVGVIGSGSSEHGSIARAVRRTARRPGRQPAHRGGRGVMTASVAHSPTSSNSRHLYRHHSLRERDRSREAEGMAATRTSSSSWRSIRTFRTAVQRARTIYRATTSTCCRARRLSRCRAKREQRLKSRWRYATASSGDCVFTEPGAGGDTFPRR